MTIRVTVGSLVLEGVRPADRDRVVAGFERELGRLLSGPDAAAALANAREPSHVPARSMSAAVDDLDALGEHVARAVFDAVGRRRTDAAVAPTVGPAGSPAAAGATRGTR